MTPHGNSNLNQKPHHVYVIYDKQSDDIYKYGISHDPLEADGLSARLRDQLDLFNRIAGWSRFNAEILHRDLQGRVKAKQIETRLIRAYRELHGHRPLGNLSD
jgi:URI fold toxin 2